MAYPYPGQQAGGGGGYNPSAGGYNPASAPGGGGYNPGGAPGGGTGYNPGSHPGGGGGAYNPAAPSQTAYIPGSQQTGGPAGYYGQQQQPGGQQQPQSGWSNQAPAGVDPNLYHWFLAVDQDRSGRIVPRELKQALLNGNWSTFSEDACRMMISLFDRNKHGSIDITEFQNLWNYIQQWRSVFERYDQDRSGYIEQTELQRAVNEMGYRLTPQFFSSIVSKYDPKTKKQLSLDDFIVFCVQLQLFTNSFRERDTSRSGVITINYEDFLACVFLTKP